MGIILIDSKAWDKILERLVQFTRLLNERLGVGKRTLQNYRGRGLLPYTQISHKCYYKPEDVKAFLENHLCKSVDRDKL